MKYDKMVAITQQESNKKIKEAKKALADMLEGMEKISVARLAERTGLSRGFFYKNPEVRNALNQAKHIQEVEGYELKPNIQNEKLLDIQNNLLEINIQNRKLLQMNQALEQANMDLKRELEKLQRQVKHKEVSILKNL